MKHQRCVWILLATALLLSSLGVSEASAFGPRRGYAGPAYYSYPMYDYPAYSAYGTPYYSAYGYPYVMPLPGYGILPLPLATPNYGLGYGYEYPYSSTRPIADGYPRVSNEPAPRTRSSLYPAVPYQAAPAAEQAASRRVRFEITLGEADAIVTFDGVKTKQTGLNRVFVTPPMDNGKEFTVTIEVLRTEKDGKLTVTRRRAFTVKAGETIQHSFVAQ